MFIVDDVLLSPMRGLVALAREIHNAAIEELERSIADARRQLAELYLALESGAVTEAEFDEREAELLDLLDALEGGDEGEGEEVEDAEDDEDAGADEEPDANSDPADDPAGA